MSRHSLARVPQNVCNRFFAHSCFTQSHTNSMAQVMDVKIGKPGLPSHPLPCVIVHGFNTMPLVGEHINIIFAPLGFNDALCHRITNQNATAIPSLNVLSWNIKHRYTKFRNRNLPFPFQTTDHLVPNTRVQIEQDHLC